MLGMMRNAQQRRNEARAHREGPVAREIEDQTAKLPSDIFLWAAGAAVASSWLLRLAGKKEASNFVGQWVPSILICGVYNKIVKTHGHDREDRAPESEGQASEIEGKVPAESHKDLHTSAV